MISDMNKNYKLQKPKYLLDQNMALLKKSGLLPINNKTHIKHRIFLFLSVFFVSTQCIEIYVSKNNIFKLLRNIKYSMLSSLVMIKAMSFLFWQKKWICIIDFANEVNLERYKSEDAVSIKITKKVFKYCRNLTSFYCYLTICTAFMTIIHPAAEYYLVYAKDESTYRLDLIDDTEKYILITPSWVPFDRNNLIVYVGQMIYQVYTTLHTGIFMATYDTCAICIMVFFHGEFELLKIDSQNLYGTVDDPVSKEIARFRMIKCHKRFNDLMKYVKLFDSCLSPIMLLYVIVCSVMLCATAYQLTVETNAMQKFLTAEYLIFGVSQLFMFCWHSNEVLYVSRDLSRGPYESMWWTRRVSEQKDISILIDQFNKEIVFSAGPFTCLTVATFISILKGAYSYYTLLSQSEED